MITNTEDLKSRFVKIRDSLNDLFENEPNPFVQLNIKNIYGSFAEGNFEIPDHIPLRDELKKKIILIANTLKEVKNLFPVDIKKELRQIRSLFNNLNLSNTELWELAEIFLKLPSIMKLSRYDSKRIINIIKNKTSGDIEEFLKEKYENQVLKQSDLEAEVKKTKIKRLNLNTLINQVYQKKPKEQFVFEKIKSNLNNLNFFKKKQIYLSTEDLSTIYIGEIKDCKLQDDGKIIFNSVSLSGEESDITINFNDHGIIDATLIKKFEQTLKERIYQKYHLYTKEGEVILGNAYITKNKDFLSQKTKFSQEGYYNIIMGSRFLIKTGHYLILEYLQTRKRTELEVCDNGVQDGHINLKEATINHTKWVYPCDFDEFLRFFNVRTEEKTYISFSSENEVNRHFQIKDNTNAKNESFEIVKKTKEIFNFQTNLIKILIEDEDSLFDLLIETLLTLPNYRFCNNNILEIVETRQNTILEGLNEILLLKKSLGQQTDELEILTEIVFECNYNQMIKKEQGINTKRIFGMLTEGKKITDQIKGKTIIAFFGNTGSGKSTTVNYFAGIPLKKETNNYGDEIIIIDEDECQGHSAKIGQSLGTSETLYAQAFNLLEDAYEEETIPKHKANDLFLCDNPGFRDTRGNEFEMCTNLSIDQAILNCGKLQAAVLVLPFSVFSLDRGNRLIEAICNLEERFPNFLDKDSKTHKSVFIAITKYNSVQQIDCFEERLTKHIAEEIEKLSDSSKSNEDQITVKFLKKRLQIFNSLLEMYKSKRMFFINVVDNYQQQEQFSEIYKCKGIDKSSYNRSMDGRDLLRKFMEEINKTCHTWTYLILESYLGRIPVDLQKLKGNIKNLSDNIANKKSEIEDTTKSIAKWKQEIDLNSKRKSEYETEDCEILPDLEDDEIKAQRKELKEMEGRIESLRIKLEQKQKEIKSTTQEIKTLEDELKEKRNSKENLSKGETEFTLVEDKYIYGQEYQYGEYIPGRLEEALREVKPKRVVDNEKLTKFKPGFIDINLVQSHFVEKKFCLVPENIEFDQEGLLQRYQQGAIYKAEVHSNLCQLTGVNASIDGKRIVIQYEKTFKTGTDLPYLKITHKIPNEKYNADHIINLNSEIDLCQSRISTLNRFKTSRETEKNELEEDLKNLEKQKKEVEGIIKKKLVAKSKELKMKQIDEQIKILENRISDSNAQITRKEKEIKNDEATLEEERGELIIKEKEHKKLALLIWDQLQKNIPQSLFEFINIAYEIESKTDLCDYPQNIKEAKQLQFKNFEAFKEIFSREYPTLKNLISKHLNIEF